MAVFLMTNQLTSIRITN